MRVYALTWACRETQRPFQNADFVFVLTPLFFVINTSSMAATFVCHLPKVMGPFGFQNFKICLKFLFSHLMEYVSVNKVIK